MITIKQLANTLGVSKQAVYNRVTKDPLRSVLEETDGAMQISPQGTILLSEEGAAVVTSAYEEKYRPNKGANHVGYGRAVVMQPQANDDTEKFMSHVSAIQDSMDKLHEYQQQNSEKIDKLLQIVSAQVKLLHDKMTLFENKIEEGDKQSKIPKAVHSAIGQVTHSSTPRSDIALKHYEAINKH
jgi:hypothetical protein